MQKVLTVLFVCTGNVCRSPAAAALATSGARPEADVVFASAGLAALVGEPVDPPVAAELAKNGVLAADHRARQYRPQLALAADVVLTATGEQADRILRDVPQALRRVFTIKEFARLAAQAGALPAELPAAVAAIAAMRGRVEPVDAGEDDIRDPYRRGPDVVTAVVGDLADAVRTILRALGLDAPRAARPAPARRRPLPYRR